jgi:hypothetical protein
LIDQKKDRPAREPESAIQAYWRTIFRDCTAPPNMRRLNNQEISGLGVINVKLLRAGKSLEICHASLGQSPGSAFNYYPNSWRHRQDLNNDDSIGAKLAGLPHAEGSFIFIMTEDGPVMRRTYSRKRTIYFQYDLKVRH